MSLIFGNVLEDDILIREELNALTAAHPKRFKVGSSIALKLCQTFSNC